jgi:hypothetical protein
MPDLSINTTGAILVTLVRTIVEKLLPTGALPGRSSSHPIPELPVDRRDLRCRLIRASDSFAMFTPSFEPGFHPCLGEPGAVAAQLGSNQTMLFSFTGLTQLQFVALVCHSLSSRGAKG